MAEIQRYSICGDATYDTPDGAVVYYKDHLADKAAALKAKDEEIVKLEAHNTEMTEELEAIDEALPTYVADDGTDDDLGRTESVSALLAENKTFREVQGELVEAAKEARHTLNLPDVREFQVTEITEALTDAIERAEGKP